MSELLARTTGCEGKVPSLLTPWSTNASAWASESAVIIVVRKE